MTSTAWILIGVATAVSIAFPVALVAMARVLGGGRADKDADVDGGH